MNKHLLLLAICASLTSCIYAQNNVGIGTLVPHSSAALDIYSDKQGLLIPRMTSVRRAAMPSPLAHGLLVFDTDTGCIMLFDSAASSWKSLCKSNTSIVPPIVTGDFDCGIGTLSIGANTSAHRAWLLSGSSPTDSTNYLGTYNNEDIRISTNNDSCSFNPLKGKMTITKDGNVGIGYTGTKTPTYPQNKLLIENGPPITRLNLYSDIIASYFGNAGNVGLVSAGNSAGNFNVAMASIICRDSIQAVTYVSNIGAISLVNSSNSKNSGYAIDISGNNADNTGFGGELGTGSSNARNREFSANTGTRSRNSYNIGYNAKVGQGSTGCTNAGFIDTVLGNGGPSNTGIGIMIKGQTTNATGIRCELSAVDATGNHSTDLAGVNVSLINGTDATASNYGIKGDLSAGNPSGNTPYFAIYGIAPLSGVSGTTGTSHGVNSPNSYAGYFDGDVFCSNTYYFSDPKLKENITDYTDALDKLRQLQVKKYTFRKNEYPAMNFPQGDQVGVLSTDLKKIFPNLVKQSSQPAIEGKGESVAFEAVNYNALIPILIEAVKELDKKAEIIAEQSREINEIRTKLDMILKK